MYPEVMQDESLLSIIHSLVRCGNLNHEAMMQGHQTLAVASHLILDALGLKITLHVCFLKRQ